MIGLDDDDLPYFESLYNASSNGNVMSVGLCGVLPLSTCDSTNIPQSRAECFDGTAYKPSIGIDGAHCVCVRPNESHDVDTEFDVDFRDFVAAQVSHDHHIAARDRVEDTGSVDDVYELWQSDFEDGTFRFVRSLSF